MGLKDPITARRIKRYTDLAFNTCLMLFSRLYFPLLTMIMINRLTISYLIKSAWYTTSIVFMVLCGGPTTNMQLFNLKVCIRSEYQHQIRTSFRCRIVSLKGSWQLTVDSWQLTADCWLLTNFLIFQIVWVLLSFQIFSNFQIFYYLPYLPNVPNSSLP